MQTLECEDNMHGDENNDISDENALLHMKEDDTHGDENDDISDEDRYDDVNDDISDEELHEYTPHMGVPQFHISVNVAVLKLKP